MNNYLPKSIHESALEGIKFELENCTEKLFELATNSSTISRHHLTMFQRWIDCLNDGDMPALYPLQQLEKWGLGHTSILRSQGATQHIKVKDVYPNGPNTEIFQQALDDLNNYYRASDFLASIPDFDPISDETTQHFDGLLTSFGAEGDEHVNELLSIETPGLWEVLDVPPINQEQDNLPGAPASDAEAIDYTLGIIKLPLWRSK